MEKPDPLPMPRICASSEMEMEKIMISGTIIVTEIRINIRWMGTFHISFFLRQADLCAG